MSDVVLSGAGPAVDRQAFRNALGRFATGVTVITARDAEAGLVGITANSFSSVSLDPPMVLWSLSRTSSTLEYFRRARHFCVNVLAADQIELSNRFAGRHWQKFDGVPIREGLGGAPVLEGCAAVFECATSFVYEGGDHLIFVGEVQSFTQNDAPTLLFHRGRYAVSGPHPAFDSAVRRSSAGRTPFLDDYLDYLLARAAAAFQQALHSQVADPRLQSHDWRILAALADYDGCELDTLLASVILPLDALLAALQRLQRHGLLESRQGWNDAEAWFLTAAGRELAVRLLANAKAHETDVLGRHFSAEEAFRLKEFLNRLL